MRKNNLPDENDSSKIELPHDPDHLRLHLEIVRFDDLTVKACANPKHLTDNWKDWRYYLTYSMAATEDFLARTSKDPHYARSDNRKAYDPGGWLE